MYAIVCEWQAHACYCVCVAGSDIHANLSEIHVRALDSTPSPITQQYPNAHYHNTCDSFVQARTCTLACAHALVQAHSLMHTGG